jgi:hypothetical protein
MAARTKKARPGMKLKLGASVLAAARALDTRLVKDGLARFQQAHRDYVDAQRKVDAAQSALDAARARVLGLHADQDDAVETLARRLYVDGYPRKNPFTAFAAPSASTIARMAVADGVEAIGRLVAAVLRRERIGKDTAQAAQSALAAARAVEQAVASVAKLQDSDREARATRDAIGRGWESALRALRLRAHAAADEGAPQLYATLFPPVRRAARKVVNSEPAASRRTGSWQPA